MRAVAAMLVLLYHLDAVHFSAGFIGVDIFFVISGFLITSLLVRSRQKNGRMDLRTFWRKRVRRLVPAVVMTTVCGLALARLVGGDALVGMGWQGLGSITGTYNWFEIANSASYFDQQSPQLLTNMWSLAVEQQFYLFWPLLLAGILLLPRRWRPGAALGLAGVSAIASQLASMAAEDVTRAYVGTDTHAYGLMIGAAVALAFPHALEGEGPRLTVRGYRALGVGSWLALTAIILLAVLMPDDDFMYPWGTVLASLLGGVVVLGFLGGEGAGAPTLMGLLNSRVMVWLGERSYGIYLWHWPLRVLFFYAFHPSPWVNAMLVTVLSVLLAHLSYTYVETPIRREGLTAWVRRIYLAHRDNRGALAMRVGAAAVVLALALTAVGTSHAESSAQEYIEQGRAALGTPATPPAASGRPAEQPAGDNKVPAAGNTAGNAAVSPVESAAPDGAASVAPSGAATAAPHPKDSTQVTIIGDSVALAAAPALRRAFPGALIDAEVSRSVRVAPDLMATYARQGKLGTYVVIALATNATIRERDWNAIDRVAGPDRRIVFATGYGPADKTWISAANTEIQALAQAHPDRVRVADWASIAAAHQDELAGDHVHPDGRLAPAYAQAVKDAVDSF